jgi:cation diffusion facilitator family transporter
MPLHPLQQWQHGHDFHLQTREGERRTLLVIWLTGITMLVEVSAGYLSGSMALLADGWHMGTHMAALSISLFAYRYARKHARNPRYSFGTGKVGALGGFASAMALAVVALLMGFESLHRLVQPERIHFDEAILVAVLGLGVNLLSAWLLRGGRGPHHHHKVEPGHHHHHHQDQNLRAAYLHVVADALTSLLAIIALSAGKYLGWTWMDALMGLVGAYLITRWGVGLLRETSAVLLDRGPSPANMQALRDAIEADADNEIADLHVWSIGPGHFAAIISVVTHHPRDPGHYKSLLADHPELSHITVEVNRCSEACAATET